MKRAKVVIGANFGDEGKGLVTDYLAHQARADSCLVVRFNGGAQAGHTVVTPSGTRHVFHHFGSGTLAGARTFLSQFFICNPILFAMEAESLLGLGVSARVFADARCLVTTPYDMLINQIVEDARGDGRLGSCGVGINETVERSKHPDYCLTAGVLGNRDLVGDILRAIQLEWVPRRLREHGHPVMTASQAAHLSGDDMTNGFMRDCRIFASLVTPDRDRQILPAFKHVIFEGAQGLLLDQNSRFFPYVTRSNTGLTNVVALAREGGIDGLDVTYVTRAYMTRHGAGPFPTEYKVVAPFKFDDATNVDHPYQGRLRVGMLALDTLCASLRADGACVPSTMALQRGIAVTHLDQMGDGPIHFTRGGAGQSRRRYEFLDAIEDGTTVAVTLAAYGPTRADVSKRTG